MESKQGSSILVCKSSPLTLPCCCWRSWINSDFFAFLRFAKCFCGKKKELSEYTKKGESRTVFQITGLSSSLGCSGTVMSVPLPLVELRDFSGSTPNLHCSNEQNQRSWEANRRRLEAWEWRKGKEEGRKYKQKKSLWIPGPRSEEEDGNMGEHW